MRSRELLLKGRQLLRYGMDMSRDCLPLASSTDKDGSPDAAPASFGPLHSPCSHSIACLRHRITFDFNQLARLFAGQEIGRTR